MLTDRTKLGFEVRGNKLYVMYPRKRSQAEMEAMGMPTLELAYEGGFPVEFPKEYFTNPPNDITRERVEIYQTLLRGAEYAEKERDHESASKKGSAHSEE